MAIGSPVPSDMVWFADLIHPRLTRSSGFYCPDLKYYITAP